MSLVLEVNLSLFSGKMECPLKAPVSTLPSHFFVLFRENVCANEVFPHDKCPRIQFSIQQSPFTRILWIVGLADVMKYCSNRFIVTTACVLIGLHLPGRSNASKSSKPGLKAKLHPQAQSWALDVVC